MENILVMLLVDIAMWTAVVDLGGHKDIPAAPKRKPLNLASIDQSQMESFAAVWPVKPRFSKKDEVWRWYDGNGNVVALLRKHLPNGKTANPLTNGAIFVQGASDYRFVRVYRDGREIGYAGWFLSKSGKWQLLISNWSGKNVQSARGGHSRTDVAERTAGTRAGERNVELISIISLGLTSSLGKFTRQ
jgi:hypothetical protein